jgi:very-short-patch-repair endonuclease
MTRLYNKKPFKLARRILRKQMTPAEVRLWTRLRYKQVGYRFLRQYSVGKFILDFYCPDIHLAIEVDGGGHNDKITKAYDQERTRFLNSINIQVIRFWNDEVLKHTDDVIEVIMIRIHQICHKTHT